MSEQTCLSVFELGKPPKNLCILPTFYCSNATFQHIESFCSIFTQFKAECDADSLLVQVHHFLCMPGLQRDEHRLGISTWPYSEITLAKA